MYSVSSESTFHSSNMRHERLVARLCFLEVEFDVRFHTMDKNRELVIIFPKGLNMCILEDLIC
jgi:hypothetical protein